MLSFTALSLPLLCTELSHYRSTDPFHSRIAASLLLLLRVHSSFSPRSSNLWSSEFFGGLRGAYPASTASEISSVALQTRVDRAYFACEWWPQRKQLHFEGPAIGSNI